MIDFVAWEPYLAGDEQGTIVVAVLGQWSC
jgi:hypothetical protein